MLKRIIVCTIVGMLSAGTMPAITNSASKVQEFIIVAPQAGGSGFMVDQAIADIVTKYCPGVRATVIASSGAPASIQQAASMDPNVGWTHLVDVGYRQAIFGLPPMAKKYPNLRLIAGFGGAGYFYATLDPRIKGTKDLAGKTIALLPKGWPAAMVYTEGLKVEGLLDKVNVKYLGFDAAASALKDGTVHAIQIVVAQAPGPWPPYASQFGELMQTESKRFHVFVPSKDVLNQAMKNINFYLSWSTCPIGSFPNQTQPFEVITIMTPGLGVFAEADEDLVYRVTKTLAKESHRFKEYLPAWPTPITPESMVKLLGFLDDPEKEIHPGAWKYYKEAGLTKLLKK